MLLEDALEKGLIANAILLALFKLSAVKFPNKKVPIKKSDQEKLSIINSQYSIIDETAAGSCRVQLKVDD